MEIAKSVLAIELDTKEIQFQK